jgi:hypothetical protein
MNRARARLHPAPSPVLLGAVRELVATFRLITAHPKGSAESVRAWERAHRAADVVRSCRERDEGT